MQHHYKARRHKDEHDYRQEIVDLLTEDARTGRAPKHRRNYSHRAHGALRAMEDAGLIVGKIAPRAADGGFGAKTYTLSCHLDPKPAALDYQIERVLVAPRASSDFGLGVLEPVLLERLHVLQAQGYVRYEEGLWRWSGAALVREVVAAAESRDLFNRPIKTCPKCESVHAYTEAECEGLFGRHTATMKDGTKKAGFQSWCRECRRRDNQQRYESAKAQTDLFKQGVAR